MTIAGESEDVRLVAANERIKKLERRNAELQDEIDNGPWFDDGLTADQESSLRRVHRYLCENDAVEAVRELQHAFPELGLRPLETERSFIPERNIHVS